MSEEQVRGIVEQAANEQRSMGLVLSFDPEEIDYSYPTVQKMVNMRRPSSHGAILFELKPKSIVP